MESGETFTDDKIKPFEHDYDLKICIQYFYLGSNRKNGMNGINSNRKLI